MEIYTIVAVLYQDKINRMLFIGDRYCRPAGHGDKWPAEPETSTLEIVRDGDQWTVTNQVDDKPAQTILFKEGEKKTTTSPDGVEMEIEGHVEGDKWVVLIKAMGTEIRGTAYVDGNELVQEQTINGVTYSSRFIKI